MVAGITELTAAAAKRYFWGWAKEWGRVEIPRHGLDDQGVGAIFTHEAGLDVLGWRMAAPSLTG